MSLEAFGRINYTFIHCSSCLSKLASSCVHFREYFSCQAGLVSCFLHLAYRVAKTKHIYALDSAKCMVHSLCLISHALNIFWTHTLSPALWQVWGVHRAGHGPQSSGSLDWAWGWLAI